ncbi:hypothetical protein BBJ28_00003237 [Nothophytophthora sp. Chile5]|nr:hypothetical protein BBJ28_00003237 [Nothophytophthora sp. Chile5]
MAFNALFVADDLVSSPSLSPVATGKHAYFRSSNDEVWGFPGNSTVKYSRSPCPALNSLANHGHIPRDGKALTPEILKKAVMKVYNFDAGLVNLLSRNLPQRFSLSYLGEHNFIEHDGSLLRVDTFFKHDPSWVNETLVNGLLAQVEDLNGGGDAVINKQVMAQLRRLREADSARDNPEFAMNAYNIIVAYGEAALGLLGLGDSVSATISVEHARSFLVDERIPADFRPSKTPISTSDALFVAAQLKFLAWFS